jgi:hypothetical protein
VRKNYGICYLRQDIAAEDTNTVKQGNKRVSRLNLGNGAIKAQVYSYIGIYGDLSTRQSSLTNATNGKSAFSGKYHTRYIYT